MIELTSGRWQSKTPILLRNLHQKSIETVFWIAICRPTGNKWQSKTLFPSIFDLRWSIVDYVFDCRLPGVVLDSDHQLEDSFKKFTTERVNQGIEKTSYIVIG